MFKFSFKKNPVEFNPNSGMTKKLMGDKFPLLAERTRKYRALLQELPREELELTTADGLKLKGWFFDAGSKNTAIFVHGYNSCAFKDNVAHAYIFLNRGYNVLLFDNRACGASEGEYLTFGVRECEDLALWVDLIAKRIPDGNIVLHGTSLGGATVLLASSMDLPNVKRIVEDCGYKSIQWEFECMARLFAHFVPRLTLKAAERVTKRKLGFDFSTISPINSVAQAKYPVMFVHGKADTFIPCAAAEEMYAHVQLRKSFCSLTDLGTQALNLPKMRTTSRFLRLLRSTFNKLYLRRRSFVI